MPLLPPAVRRATARALAPALAVAGATVLWGAGARAGEFFADGSYAFDPAATYTFDFEHGPPDNPDPEATPVDVVSSDSALSGSHVASLAEFGDADVVLELPPLARSYRVSLWVRGGDAVGYFVVSHGGAADEIATLYPTGRVTSDGWVELANSGLRIDGARSAGIAGAFSPTGCELDAVEVVSEGPIARPVNPSCAGTAEASACGVGQQCYWSECRNVDGWVPPIPPDRDDVRAYLTNRLRFLFGPYLERQLDMPSSMSAIEGMKQATDRWGYWNGFMLAVRRLHDGHTSTSGLAGYAIDNPKPFNVCFIEGDADLTQGTAKSEPGLRDVLVSHVGAVQTLGLGPGDRLVRVDGVHPIAWARSLVEINWPQPAVSNHSTFAEHAASLRALISRFADQIEVIRCDPLGQSCGALETISLSALPSVDKDSPIEVVTCDNRPLRHVPGAPVSHGGGYYDVFYGLLNESDSTEKIYGAEWESLMTTTGNDGVGANLAAAVQSFTGEGARGVIFDHRTGFGGTMAGPKIVWDFAVPRHPISFSLNRQRAEDEQPTLAEGLAIYQQAENTNWVDFAGSSSPTTIPVALLITEDVSASDWLPLGFKGAASNVRIFGPYQSNGGFSTRYMLGYWLGMSYVLASGDTFLPDGSTANGHGVEPDQVVLPRQSDLLAGKDTVFEAALAWVRQEAGP